MTPTSGLGRASLPVPLIGVRGAPGDCGIAYGAAARDLIAANLDFYRRRFRDEVGLDVDAVRAAGLAFRDTTREHHPRIAELLDGVAQGASAHVAEIYALNARTELITSRPLTSPPVTGAPSTGPPVTGVPVTRVPVVRSADAGNGACTAVGVLGTHTASGHLLLGQNWDWHPDQRDVMVLLATQDERGVTVLTLTEAGMVAKTGLNSAGVGACVNMLGSDRDGLPGPGVAPGVPYHVLLRAALEADSLAAALKAVCRGTRNSSINILLGQAAGAGGELIDLELVPGDVGWSHPVNGMITHANHLETGLAVRDTMKDVGGSSLFRSARARRLLTPQAALGKLDEEDLARLFRDHASYPQAICRHVDERDALPDRSMTVYSVLLDLDDLRLGIAAGPPCRHGYAWLDLADAVNANASAGNVSASTAKANANAGTAAATEDHSAAVA